MAINRRKKNHREVLRERRRRAALQDQLRPNNEAIKQVLRSAERLRAAGVKLITHGRGFDSWGVR